MLEGIIVKGIGGFYYVRTKEKVYECRARGLFREEKKKPLVGDRVKIRVNDDGTGYVEEILDRTTELLRPAVANVDQVIIAMSLKSPDINLWLLDKFLVMAEHEGLDITIALSKTDLVEGNVVDRVKSIYEKAGYRVVSLSNLEGKGVEEIKSILKGRITVFAGPSGVGKSTLINSIDSRLSLETGVVSEKTSRGKHTTRHVELIDLGKNSYVLDSPGFSSLDLKFIESKEELSHYFREFIDKNQPCKFVGCLHDKEPKCSVKSRVEEGVISEERYKNYLKLLEEVGNIRRY